MRAARNDSALSQTWGSTRSFIRTNAPHTFANAQYAASYSGEQDCWPSITRKITIHWHQGHPHRNNQLKGTAGCICRVRWSRSTTVSFNRGCRIIHSLISFKRSVSVITHYAKYIVHTFRCASYRSDLPSKRHVEVVQIRWLQIENRHDSFH